MTAVERFLVWAWDLMDISENIKRAEKATHNVANDLLSSGMQAIAMWMLSIVAFALAWHFDFESTLIGMTTLTTAILPGLPSTVAPISIYIGWAFTIAPTLIEIFTAAYAKAEIKIVQLAVVGFTFFDAVTDIPRAMSFTNSLQAHFNQLGILAIPVKYGFFLFWLLLSTIGFELLLVIFTFLALVFTFKAFNLRKAQVSTISSKKMSSGSTAKVADVIEIK